MKITGWGHQLCVERNFQSEYPKLSMTLAVLILYLAPFVSRWLAVLSFVICLYRVFRYDAKVFATDYAILLPLVSLTHAPGTPALLIYLCLIAGIRYLLTGGLRANASFVLLIVLMNYLLTRMQMDINAFVLCFGQLFVLCVLLPKQDEASVVRTVKMFITSLILSSLYAFVLRNTAPIREISGDVSYAIWGTNILRFKGLFPDPNYYMTLLIIGLALLVKLKECKMLGTASFVVQGVALAAFGVLTYSKTFFLVFMLLGVTYVLWQFWSKRIISGTALTILVLVALNLIVFAEGSPFSVVIQRLMDANSLSDLTTGRTDVYLAYWAEITEDAGSFFFGKGLAADGLRKDPHNIYLEIIYYTGMVGFCLIVGIYTALVRENMLRAPNIREQHFIARYVVLFMFLILFFSLHGMFQAVAYGELFLAMLSLMITKKQIEIIPEEARNGEEMKG